MEKTNQNYTYPLIFSLVTALAIPSFVFCILAEFKKSKVKDVKLDGELCELKGSEAFGFGIAALVCSSIAQIIGNVIIFVKCCPESREQISSCWTKKPSIANVLLVVSWISFAVSGVLISTASSMNRRQPYGRGWLNGECYIVKDGFFIGVAILVLISLGCILVSAVMRLSKKNHVSIDEKDRIGAFSTTGVK